jgi:hypothetical protein
MPQSKRDPLPWIATDRRSERMVRRIDLEPLTQRVLESSPADQAAGECEEGFVDLVAAVGAQEQSAAVVEPGEGAFDDPALAAEAGAMLGLSSRDDGLDPALPDEPAVLVVVVAAVSDQPLRTSARPADSAAHGRDEIEQCEQLRDVVAVSAGQRPGERDAPAVYEQVLLAAATAPVDGAGTRLRAPFFACT